MNRKIKPYIMMGGKFLKKVEESALQDFEEFVEEMKSEMEKEIERKLTEREFHNLCLLIAGIMYKYKEFDERYHAYLLGYVLEKEYSEVRK